MFGSKNKQQKNQAEISIETMEGNLKGIGEKIERVDYDKMHPSQSTENNQSHDKNNHSSTTSAKIEDDLNKQQPFKSPFKEGDLSIGEQGFVNGDNANINKINQGTFPSAEGNSIVSQPKKEDSTFLHQTLDNNTKIKDKPNVKSEGITIKKDKQGVKSFLFIILFIGLLAGILLGGYYFYMNKQNTKTQTGREGKETASQTNKQADRPTNKPKTPVNQNTKKETTKTVPRVEKLLTTIETFNSDLKKFITQLKDKRSEIDLQNGIFVSPMKTENIVFTSRDMIEALHMTEFFSQTDLKDNCKLFIMRDGNHLRISVVFELTDTADDKLIKGLIIQKETELVRKMNYLFVDGAKPVVPTDIQFATNVNNKNARYFNYQPGVTESSVDWNILDLGKGRLVYFATSRKSAKVLTDYFIRTVVK